MPLARSRTSRSLGDTMTFSTSSFNSGPEAEATYTLRICGEAGSMRRTYSGLAGASQTYTLADDTADSGLG